MAPRQRKRDPRYSRTIGAKPHVGRRYVQNGRVMIQWTEDGKRHSRTMGANSAETRRRADAELEDILMRVRGAAGDAEPSEQAVPFSIEEALRTCALSLLDVADDVVERVQRAMRDSGS